MRFLDVLQEGVDIAAIFGVGIALAFTIRFLSSPVYIGVGDSGVTIQGIPFAWVFGSLVVGSLGNALRSLRRMLGKRGLPGNSNAP